MAGSRTDVMVPLPRPLTSLIGREQELNHLYELLRSDAALVTITGFGGIGKTRLALQVALELEPIFDAGAIFAPLASVTQGNGIPKAIAITAGLDESVDSAPALAEALGASTRLLVLDNLEQISDAAETVLSLLQAMPNITILVTSRNRLEISGEYVVPLEPLDTRSDNPESLPAVQLFIQRARAADPLLPSDPETIRTIAEICQKLDGIPLAIELAAARLAIFSPKDLRDQLENTLPVLASKRVDLPDRQRTMRNAIAWTYELLTMPERRLFSWLTVYEQDFSLESVAHVARQQGLIDDPLDLAQFLISRSLARPSRHESAIPRFQMLQMLREFGQEMLIASSDDTLARHSHAQDMVTLAERAEPHLTTNEAQTWFQRLHDELPNILATLTWCRTTSEHEVGQRLFGAVWRYPDSVGMAKHFLPLKPDTHNGTGEPLYRAKALIGIGYLSEGIQDLQPARIAFEQALALTNTMEDKELHVRALTGLATIHYNYSEISIAENMLNDAQDLAKRTGNIRGQIIALGMLANIKLQLLDGDESIRILEEVVSLLEEIADQRSIGIAIGNLGNAYLLKSRDVEAEKCYLRALEIAQQIDDTYSAITAHVNLALVAGVQKDDVKAEAYIRQGLELARENGTIVHEGVLLGNLASCLMKKREWTEASQLISDAATLLDNDAGIKHQPGFAHKMHEICMVLGMKDEAAEMLAATRSMRERYQVIAEDSEEQSEEESLLALDTKNNPRYIRIMSDAEAYDRSTLVQRIAEIANTITTTSHHNLATTSRRSTPTITLTPREIEVVGMAARGLTNAEIADEMFVSKRTVTTHLTNIFGKLEVKNRSGAIAAATQAGLI